jgi:hypothetical protein
MLDDIQDKVPSNWDKMKKNIFPKCFKKIMNDKTKQISKSTQEKIKDVNNKKGNYAQLLRKKTHNNKNQSRNKIKLGRKKTKRGKQNVKKTAVKVGLDNFKQIQLNEMDPYEMIIKDKTKKKATNRISKSRNLNKTPKVLKSQDFDKVFRLRKDFEMQYKKKKKNSYLSNQPVGLISPIENKDKGFSKQFLRFKTELQESEILSSKLASRKSSFSLEKKPTQNVVRRKTSRLKFAKKKGQLRALSINSSSSEDEHIFKLKKTKKAKKEQKKQFKNKNKNQSKDFRKGFQKLKNFDPTYGLMSTMKSRANKQYGEFLNEPRDQSRYSTKRTKVIKKKSNFENFMEKMEKIEKIEKNNKRQLKSQKQKEERVKNEYYKSRKGSQQQIEISNNQGSTRFSVRNGQISTIKNLKKDSAFDIDRSKNQEKAKEKFPTDRRRLSVKPMAEGGQLLLTQNEERDRLRPIWGWIETLNQNELSEVLNQLTQCKTHKIM